jgi:hypothetical protein
MLMLFPIVLALAGDPSPAPEASNAARPTPLTEIGRVRALPACVPIVAHANGAITQALDNDRTIAMMSINAHSTDFDKQNILQRRNSIQALMKQAEAIRVASSSGEVEVKKLREYANAATDPQRKAELKEFADALGGALYRQKKAAVEFMRNVTVLEGREAAVVALNEIKPVERKPIPGSAMERSTEPPRVGLQVGAPESYNRVFAEISDRLDQDFALVRVDEGSAADHSIAATSGC